MEVLMAPTECKSGCGIYAVGEKCKNNIISYNIVRNVKDCGIFANRSVGDMTANKIISFPQTVDTVGDDSAYMADKLDEKHICSLNL